MNNKPIFFILGCVRSGTTLLRDILKSHPNLICPEETHFYRWSDPFGSGDFNHINTNVETLQMHRKIDGVDENSFQKILKSSLDRKDLMQNYVDHFAIVNKNIKARCFDKTPQNIYALPLIKAQFPEAKIIHIVRNPLNVVASLKRGRGLSPQSIIGAINFWKEAIMIINTMKPILADNLYEFKYENLTNNPKHEISNLLNFLSEEDFDISQAIKTINPAFDSYKEVLTHEEIQLVEKELSKLMQIYAY